MAIRGRPDHPAPLVWSLGTKSGGGGVGCLAFFANTSSQSTWAVTFISTARVTTEPIATALRDSYTENASLADAVSIAVGALTASSDGSEPRALGPSTLEVALLDANRPRRAFRRVTGAALETLLPQGDSNGEVDTAKAASVDDGGASKAR